MELLRSCALPYLCDWCAWGVCTGSLHRVSAWGVCTGCLHVMRGAGGCGQTRAMCVCVCVCMCVCMSCRAPEVLYHILTHGNPDSQYSIPADMWSVGCVIIELSVRRHHTHTHTHVTICLCLSHMRVHHTTHRCVVAPAQHGSWHGP